MMKLATLTEASANVIANLSSNVKEAVVQFHEKFLNSLHKTLFGLILTFIIRVNDTWLLNDWNFHYCLLHNDLMNFLMLYSI
jgi:hypothetical protein